MTLMVVDGTWRKARRVANHLKRSVIPTIPHVILSESVVGSRLSVYRRKQSQLGRICTIEAVAMMLGEAGERVEACRELVDLVVRNNEALGYGKEPGEGENDVKKEGGAEKEQQAGSGGGYNRSLWKEVGGHPAWYYGRNVDYQWS